MNSKLKSKPQRCRAIIFNADKILLIKRIKHNEVYWVFPGGKVEDQESLETAVERECLEELGLRVKAQKLFTKLLSTKPQTVNQEEFFFICEVISGELGSGTGPEYQPDNHYEGEHRPEWLKLSEIPQLDLRPQQVRDLLLVEFN